MKSNDFEPIDLGPITVTFSVDAGMSGGTVTICRTDVAGGAGVPIAHSHDGFEETIYGLKGSTAFNVDGEEIDVGPGDTICIRRGAVHSFMAGEADASFLAIATPGVFGPDYFYDIQAAVKEAAGGPPDVGAIKEVMLRHGLTPAPH